MPVELKPESATMRTKPFWAQERGADVSLVAAYGHPGKVAQGRRRPACDASPLPGVPQRVDGGGGGAGAAGTQTHWYATVTPSPCR